MKVILLTIDALRFDRLTSGHFPKCWEIIESDFVKFQRAYSHGVGTPFSFPGILTGYPPEGNGSLSPEATTIAELINGQSIGYSNNSHLVPHRGYDRGFDIFHDGLSTVPTKKHLIERIKDIGRRSQTLDEIYQRFKSVFADLSGSYETEIPIGYDPASVMKNRMADAIIEKDADFVWGHFMDPHYPFSPNAITDREFDIEMPPSELWDLNRSYATGQHVRNMEILIDLYDENILYLDRHLAKLLERLKTSGVYDESLLIITADHGETFGEHGIQNHQFDSDPVDELIHVPLLLKLPDSDFGGKEQSHIVQQADLITTIADQLNSSEIRPPETYSLLDTAARSVISKSNTSIRVTTPEGWQIKRRDGSEESSGSISKVAKNRIFEASFPTIENISGETPGIDADSLDAQLEALGYK